MTDRPNFTIEIHQNKYLAEGDSQVHAIVRVKAGGAPAGLAARPAGAAEVIIVDTSGSMVGERLGAAKRAAKAAVDALREGVGFAVVSGADEATMIYPRDLLLAPATNHNRAQAKAAIAKLSATGGTRMGRWLTLANTLFAEHHGGIRHAILLTDGKNEHETPAELDAALAACAGRFVCDCRGVGTDWEVAELRRVSTALLGSLRLVADPQHLAADFTKMIEAAMGKAIADVVMRVWTPHNATPRFVKQVLPSMHDLSDKRVEIGPPGGGPKTGDYPTGIWGKETRDYHLCITVPAGAPHEELLAARISMVLPGSGDTPDVSLAGGGILAEWTDDEARSTRHVLVERYTGREKLVDAIQKGLKAYKKGDDDAAADELGQAVGLAAKAGDEEISRRLNKVVDVDPVTGATYLKKEVDKAHEMELDVMSTESIPPPSENGD